MWKLKHLEAKLITKSQVSGKANLIPESNLFFSHSAPSQVRNRAEMMSPNSSDIPTLLKCGHLTCPARWERCCVDRSGTLPRPRWRLQSLHQFQRWHYTGGPSWGPSRQSHPTQACREIGSHWTEVEKTLHIAHFCLSLVWTLYGMSIDKDRPGVLWSMGSQRVE